MGNGGRRSELFHTGTATDSPQFAMLNCFRQRFFDGRAIMGKLIAVVIAFFAIGAAADRVAAELVRVSWISEGDLKTKCAENGGTWSSGASGYNCSKKCGDNDLCVYGCSKGKENNECNASVPRVQDLTGLRGLSGVDKILNFAPSTTSPQPGKLKPQAGPRLRQNPRY
jgi:hypothetical protein